MRVIPLSGWNGKGLKTKLDNDDYERYKDESVVFSGGYAVIRGRRLHRLIMGEPKGMLVDHINGDRLDNRKRNLRVCNHQQNVYNSKSKNLCGYKGVTKNYDHPIWYANIYVDGKQVNLGKFSTPEDAARAYNTAVKKYRPEFGYLNVIPDSV